MKTKMFIKVFLCFLLIAAFMLIFFRKNIYVAYNNAIWKYFLKEKTQSDVIVKCGMSGDRIFLYAKGIKLKSLSFFNKFIGISILSVENTNIENIDELNLSGLKVVEIVNSPLNSLDALKGNTSITSLLLEETAVAELTQFLPRNLRSLRLFNNKDLCSLHGVEKLPIKSVTICNSPINTIEPLKSCKKLEWIGLKSLEISDICVVNDLKQLNVLNVINCPVKSVKCIKRDDFAQVILESTKIRNEKQEEKRLTAKGKGKIITTYN